MKKIILAAALAVTTLAPAFAGGYHWTNGYTRQDGTYVRGYISGNPDGHPYNNCSYIGC